MDRARRIRERPRIPAPAPSRPGGVSDRPSISSAFPMGAAGIMDNNPVPDPDTPATAQAQAQPKPEEKIYHDKEEERLAAIEFEKGEVKPQTKEEIERELEKLFFAGKAKCINGHIYKRICMMGPCPICNGLQYQFSPDEPLFDYDYEPDEQQREEESGPRTTSRGFRNTGSVRGREGLDPGVEHDNTYNQIALDHRLAQELNAELAAINIAEDVAEDNYDDYADYRNRQMDPPPQRYYTDEQLAELRKYQPEYLIQRLKAKQCPPAPPHKILEFYMEFNGMYSIGYESRGSRERIEERVHKGYVLPIFASLPLDECFTIMEGANLRGLSKKKYRDFIRSKKFRIIQETSTRFHRLNRVRVTLSTNLQSNAFRFPRDNLWDELKTQVEKEFEAEERQEGEGINIKKLSGQSAEDAEKMRELDEEVEEEERKLKKREKKEEEARKKAKAERIARERERERCRAHAARVHVAKVRVDDLKPSTSGSS